MRICFEKPGEVSQNNFKIERPTFCCFLLPPRHHAAGYGSVILDDCNFHECVDLQALATKRIKHEKKTWTVREVDVRFAKHMLVFKCIQWQSLGVCTGSRTFSLSLKDSMLTACA